MRKIIGKILYSLDKAYDALFLTKRRATISLLTYTTLYAIFMYLDVSGKILIHPVIRIVVISFMSFILGGALQVLFPLTRRK